MHEVGVKGAWVLFVALTLSLGNCQVSHVDFLLAPPAQVADNLTLVRRDVYTYTVGMLHDDVILLHRTRRQATGNTGMPGAGAKPSFSDKVGGYLDTMGSWMNKANVVMDGANQLANTASTIMGIYRDYKKAEFEQKMAELKYNLDVEELCGQICALEWGPWTRCTQRCGGGLRSRTRTLIKPGSCAKLPNFKCPHDPDQSAQCNSDCANGGRPFLEGGCECRTGFTGECCDNGVTCPFLGKPRNGNMEGEFPALYGSMVDFSCGKGYSLIGDDQTYCQANGKWSSGKPHCELVKCRKPNDPKNGRVLNAPLFYRVDEQVDYFCNHGYTMVGPAQRRCVSWEAGQGRWTGFSPFCKEVNCGDPGTPLNGHRLGMDFMLEDVVTYRCDHGFRLVGSPRRTCQPNGKWGGHEPTCEKIMCDAPEVAQFAELRGSRTQYPFGARVRFTCTGGYTLLGDDTLRCEEDEEWGVFTSGGKWDKEPPKCVGATCPDLAEFKNGVKEGSIYHFPYNVTFRCFAGHVMQGLSKIKCSRNGKWSSRMPRCLPCPKNSYREAGSEGGCAPCPVYSHTATTASINKLQCTCNEGYGGPPGGPCVEVICPMLEAPYHGKISDCNNRLDDQCDVTCNDGFVMDQGSPRRTCMSDNAWSGRDPVCKACPLGTYKSDEKSCLPCPVNSHTEQTGSVRNQCICDDGFKGPPGGPCKDIDECSELPAACSDLCRNTEGSHVCECSIPGYILAPDKKTCIQDESCRNLTEADAPDNGGLICHWYRDQNSQQCRLACNPGFTIPSFVNNFERCGPASLFNWSFEDREQEIPDCIAKEFADVKVNANTTYFVRACNKLTPAEQEAVKHEFAQMLTDQGVCKQTIRGRQLTICEAQNVGIVCGRTLRRRKRGVDEDVDEVDFAFRLRPTLEGIDVNNLGIGDCDRICEHLRIPQFRCAELCEETYRRYMNAMAFKGKHSLETAFRQTHMNFEAANRDFEPADDALETSDVISDCMPGTTSDGLLCVPCAPGRFHLASRNLCTPCRSGTYSDTLRQTGCKPCPAGTFTGTFSAGKFFRGHGAAKCTECPDGYFGKDCRQRTSRRCRHGKMDKATGECVCTSGWEGELCDTDTQSCQEDSCFPGVACRDIPAPGLGVKCGSCPTGMAGDGIVCSSM